MKIIEPTDVIQVTAVSMLIYSAPGCGKTSIAQTAERPLTLDFDRGIYRSGNRGRSVDISKWEDAANLNDPAIADCQTIVIDTVGRCLDMMTMSVANESPKNRMAAGNLTMQGWGALKARFGLWISQARILGKDVVLIAHEREDKGDGDVRIFRPDIQGGSYAEVMKFTDLVGHMHMVPQVGRVLDFSPTESYVGKNAANWNPMTVPDFSKQPKFLAGLLAHAKAVMGQVAKSTAEAGAALKEFRSRLALAKTTVDYDKLVAECEAEKEKVKRIQMKKLLKERMDANKIGWDSTLRRAFLITPEDEAMGLDELPEIDLGAVR